MAPKQCALYVLMGVKREISELGERCNAIHCMPDDVAANRADCDRQWITDISLGFRHRYRDRYRDRSTEMGLSVDYSEQCHG